MISFYSKHTILQQFMSYFFKKEKISDQVRNFETLLSKPYFDNFFNPVRFNLIKNLLI